MATEVTHVTGDEETKNLIEFYPPHPPRSDTAEYRATHRLLVLTLDQPCEVCGVRRSTLANPDANPCGAKALESHHYPIQREFADACDPVKVGRQFKQVVDRPSLDMFIDSPKNMKILCDVHHRSTTKGIHHLNSALFAIQPFLLDGYVIDDLLANEARDIQIDTQLTASENPAEQI